METPTTTEPAAPLDPAQVAADILGSAAKSMPKPEAETSAAPNPTPTTAPAPAGPILTDKAGTVFDPKRHKANVDGSPFVNARGYFMPIGGRKPKADVAAASVSAPNGAAGTPTVFPAPVSDPKADAAAKTAWGEKDRTAANATADSPETADPAAKPAGAGSEADRGSDAELSPEYGGELCARSLYLLTGAATGDHKSAAATGAEHTNLVKMFTAFLRYRGVTVKGWAALGLSALAYLIDEKRRAVVWAKIVSACGFGKPKPERRAEPVAAPDQPPVPVPVEVMPAAGPTAPSGPWADHVRNLSR